MKGWVSEKESKEAVGVGVLVGFILGAMSTALCGLWLAERLV